MFDKLYKEANDEIPINAALKEELIRKASAEPVKKTDRHTVVVRRVGFAAIAKHEAEVYYNKIINNTIDDMRYPE